MSDASGTSVERENVSDLATWNAFQGEFSAKAIRGQMARRKAAGRELMPPPPPAHPALEPVLIALR
jgi:hypothetical protein